MAKRNTRSALLLSVVSIVICFTMLLGTTMAWFTDSVTSTNNIIKTGKLDVTMKYSSTNNGTDWADASTGTIFNYQLWEPGYSDLKYVKIENVGNLAFKYQLNIIPDVATEAGDVNLAEVIDVYFAIVEEGTTYDSFDAAKGALTKVGTLADLMADPDGAAYGVLLPKEGATNVDATLATAAKAETESVTVCIVLHMQEEAGNKYQEQSVGGGFSVQLLATQFTYENDSFDNTYDEDAEYNATSVSTVADLETAVANGEDVVLSEDIALTETLQVNGDVTIYGQGNTLTVPDNGTRVINVAGNTEDVTVTLTGVNLEASDKERGISFYNNEGGLDVVIDNCEIEAQHYGVNVSSANADATLTIENSTITGYCAFQTWSAGTVATFNNCTLIGLNKWDGDGNHFATIVINEGADNSALTFNNCVIEANTTGTATEWHVIDNSENSTITFNGCEFYVNGTEVDNATYVG